MRKNVIYFIILLGLSFITYYLFFREEKPLFGTEEANFSVKNIEDIKTIYLSGLDNQRLKFSKVNNEWMVNDSLYVNTYRMRDLLEALHEQRASQPVSLTSHDYVIRDLSSNNTKVEVYDEKGKTHSFYVGSNSNTNNLTYMLNEGAKRPYIVKLPVNNAFLGIRYSANLADWRSKRIMFAQAEDIEMIDVQYKDSMQYSFTINLAPGSSPQVIGQPSIHQPLNLKRVSSYLRMWDSLYCLGFEQRNKIKDTIFTNGKQFAVIKMKAKNKGIQTLALYFKPVTQGTKGMLKVGNTKYDFDVFIGLLNNSDMVVVDRHYAEIMLRSYPEFYEPDKK